MKGLSVQDREKSDNDKLDIRVIMFLDLILRQLAKEM